VCTWAAVYAHLWCDCIQTMKQQENIFVFVGFSEKGAGWCSGLWVHAQMVIPFLGSLMQEVKLSLCFLTRASASDKTSFLKTHWMVLPLLAQSIWKSKYRHTHTTHSTVPLCLVHTGSDHASTFK
jgi:hypothetical protein